MCKIWRINSFWKIAVILAFLIFTSACEKAADDLKDTESADSWTLFNTSTGLPANQIRGIKGDSKNNIWFAISSNGAAKFSNNIWTFYKTSNSQILSNGITCIEEDASGNIIFGTTNGLSKLSPANVWSSYRHPSVTMPVVSIKATKSGIIWIGTSGQGFFKSEGTGYTQYYNSLYKNVNDIEEDSKGNIWLGTDNGLIKWDGKSYSYITKANGLPDNMVTSLRSDSKERLWIGTYFGKTVSWIDKTGMHQLSLLNGNIACEINDIWEDRKGDIWFATYESGLIRFNGVVSRAYKKYNGLPEDDFISIGEDSDGNVWVGLYSKGVIKYTLPIY